MHSAFPAEKGLEVQDQGLEKTGAKGAEKGDQTNTAFQQEKSPITLLVLVRREDIGNMLVRDTSCWERKE